LWLRSFRDESFKIIKENIFFYLSSGSVYLCDGSRPVDTNYLTRIQSTKSVELQLVLVLQMKKEQMISKVW
jgi:hypothetical protein